MSFLSALVLHGSVERDSTLAGTSEPCGPGSAPRTVQTRCCCSPSCTRTALLVLRCPPRSTRPASGDGDPVVILQHCILSHGNTHVPPGLGQVLVFTTAVTGTSWQSAFISRCNINQRRGRRLSVYHIVDFTFPTVAAGSHAHGFCNCAGTI